MAALWDKVSKIFGHLAGGKGSQPPEFYEFNDYIPPDVDQRRAFLRIQLFLPLRFWRLVRVGKGDSDPNPDSLRAGEFQRIQTNGGMGLNISGSGVLILSSEKLSAGDYIEIDDKIFGRNMDIFAKVIRASVTDYDKSNICEFAVEYVFITDGDRDFMIRSIFEKIKNLKNINDGN